jgi:hypothetical protein
VGKQAPAKIEGGAVADFKSGMSIYQVATKYGLRVLTIEALVRIEMKRNK